MSIPTPAPTSLGGNPGPVEKRVPQPQDLTAYIEERYASNSPKGR
jgi:hypothetical protein